MKFLKAGLFSLFLLCSTTAFADIQLGRDYEKLSPAQATHSGTKIEVLAFFFYGCSHCFHLHPELSAWEKKLPKDVKLESVPVIFQDSWESMAFTFYALESLGQGKRLHDELFKAWNIDNIDLRDKANAVDFVTRHGVNRAQFIAAYDSFSIGSKVSRAKQMVRDYKIRGTPTLVIDGQYLITGLTPSETIRVLNELLVQLRKAHGIRKN